MSRHPEFDIELKDSVRATKRWRCGISLVARTVNLKLAWDVQIWRISVLHHDAFAVYDFCSIRKGEAIFKG